MTRKEAEERIKAIATKQAGAQPITVLLADSCEEVHSGVNRGRGSISFWLDSRGVPLLNDTARGMRMSFFERNLPEIFAILDEEEALGAVEYIDGKRDKEANFR